MSSFDQDKREVLMPSIERSRSPISALGAVVRFIEMHGSDKEKKIAAQIDSLIKNFAVQEHAEKIGMKN